MEPMVFNVDRFEQTTINQCVTILSIKKNKDCVFFSVLFLLLFFLKVVPLGRKVIVHTDSQNIIGLQGRHDRFEKKDHRSKKNKRLNNYELYQNFYRMTDQLDFELVKVCGHQVSSQKNDIDRLFTLVDRGSRNALR